MQQGQELSLATSMLCAIDLDIVIDIDFSTDTQSISKSYPSKMKTSTRRAQIHQYHPFRILIP